jgi:hypothetical protein
MNPTKQLKLQLTLTVTYELKGGSPASLHESLNAIPKDSAGKGRFTGDTPAEVDEWNHTITDLTLLLDKPLTRNEIKARKDKDGFITAIIPVRLARLLERDIDELNDLADELILGDRGILTDTTYDPVGVDDENVLIRVRGKVEND